MGQILTTLPVHRATDMRSGAYSSVASVLSVVACSNQANAEGGRNHVAVSLHETAAIMYAPHMPRS